VAGRVTNLFTGEPLRKVNVHLSQTGRQANAKAQGYGGLSDAQGYFRFEGISAGQYSLRGDRPGFLMTLYGAKGPGQSGTFITLQAGQEMTDLSFGLIPQAVITGRVLDEDGDPVSGVQVEGLKQSWSRGKLRFMQQGGGSTNDLGEFRLGSLAPGKYFVVVQIFGMPAENEAPAIPGAPQLHQVRTFFPDSTSLDAASQITVAAGQTASGTDIHLQRVRTFNVRGKVAGGAGDRFILSLLPKDQSMLMFGAQASAAKDHTFDLSGVAPGTYTLTGVDIQNGRASPVARQPIEVGAADLNDVILSIVPPGTLRGRISVEGDGPTAPDFHPQLFLVSEEGAMGMGMSPVKFADDGTFSIENIGPGKYYPQIGSAPEGTYLKSVRWGQQELLGKELDFSNGASGDLEIVFRYGTAQVSGVVQNAPPDLTIVLVPEVLNADGSGMDFSGVDQNGAFSFKRATPGRYLAYALEQVDNNQLQNPDVLKQLASKGVEVEVKEKDNKQIQLTPIPADDLKRIFESQ
jgi:hypothetical protein